MIGNIQTVQPAPIFGPGVTAHFQVSVPTTAGGVTLESLLPGAIVPVIGTSRPSGVYLAVQDGESNKVFFTFDGQSAPAATLGFLVPAQPAPPVFIPFQSGGYVAGIVKLIAITGATKVQVKFDWNSTLG